MAITMTFLVVYASASIMGHTNSEQTGKYISQFLGWGWMSVVECLAGNGQGPRFNPQQHTHTTPAYNPGHKTEAGQRPFHLLPWLLRSISCKTSWRWAAKRTCEHLFFRHKGAENVSNHTSIKREGKGENAKFNRHLERIPNWTEMHASSIKNNHRC